MKSELRFIYSLSDPTAPRVSEKKKIHVSCKKFRSPLINSWSALSQMYLWRRRMLSNKNFLNCWTFSNFLHFISLSFKTYRVTHKNWDCKEDLKLIINTDLKVRLSLTTRKSSNLKVTNMRNENTGRINFVESSLKSG